ARRSPRARRAARPRHDGARADRRRALSNVGRLVAGGRGRARLLGRPRVRRRRLPGPSRRARRALGPRRGLRLMAASDYVELRCRSAFSFLDGASLPEDLVAAAAESGHGTLALADTNGVYGAPRFFGAARKAGIRPLVGAEVTLGGPEASPPTPPLLL